MFIRQRFFVSQEDYIKGNKKPFVIFYLKQTNNLRIFVLFNRENKMQVLYQYITKLILKTHKNKSIQFQPALTTHIKFLFHKSSVTFYIHSSSVLFLLFILEESFYLGKTFFLILYLSLPQKHHISNHKTQKKSFIPFPYPKNITFS